MLGALATSSSVWLLSTIPGNSHSGINLPARIRPIPSPFLQKTRALRLLSTSDQHCNQRFETHFFLPRASAVSSSSEINVVYVLSRIFTSADTLFSRYLLQDGYWNTVLVALRIGSTDYTEEPATNVKFQNLINSPGCSNPLSLLGIGYREKVFAIIGVKVYAAGLYVNQSISSKLDSWKGISAQVIREESSLFDSIFQAPFEKSLQIVLVRDIDGKTFWDALDEAISPRIKSPAPNDELALSTFRSIFQGRPLKKGTSIFLTWLDSNKMLVSVSSDRVPSAADATIESANVASALFDVFLGASPVSPSLKTSVANGLETMLK